MAIFDFFSRGKEEENREGTQGEPADVLTIEKKGKEIEEKLIEQKNKWIKNWEDAGEIAKITIKQKRNENYWLGLQWDNEGFNFERDEPVDNLIFESLEEALPVYTRQVAEPVIKISEPEGGRRSASREMDQAMEDLKL